MRQHEALRFATRSAFTNTSNRHGDLSSTLGQTAAYFATAAARHKWMIRSVPLRDPLPKPSRWGLLASVSKIRQQARDSGRVKSKARAGRLLKCHTVYFICMWEATGPEETAKSRLSAMVGEYGSLGRQQVEWAIRCKHQRFFQESQVFDADHWKHKDGFFADASCSWTFSLYFPQVLSFESVSSTSSRRTFQVQRLKSSGYYFFFHICHSCLSQIGRPRNDLPRALQNSVVFVIITSAKIRANRAKYHR